MVLTEQADAYNETGPICPYCGHEHTESNDVWELLAIPRYSSSNEGEGEVECAGCGKTFTFTIRANISYEFISKI